MRHRKLRIAWSVAWGVVAVLLCVLWVRSYWRTDLAHPLDQQLVIVNGKVFFGEDWRHPKNKYNFINVDFIAENGNWDSVLVSVGTALEIPLWTVVALFTLLVPLPWLRFRFSLRTLLIATTVVAVALGLIVWASR